MTGLERSIWWIEHVIRTKGARYLRSPVLDISAYQYYFLDVIGITVGALAFVCVIFYKICTALLSYLNNNSKSNNKLKSKTT